jgi:hypothetical protein
MENLSDITMNDPFMLGHLILKMNDSFIQERACYHHTGGISNWDYGERMKVL